MGRMSLSASSGVLSLRVTRIVLVVTGVLLLAVPMFSQSANGRIAGTVKDQTGGAIVGASVIVTDVARGLARNLTTDEAGAYLAPNLIPGMYTVRATFTGFQAWERANITLGVGGDVAVDVTLVPGAQTQTVTITEELPMVNTTSATLGGTLTSDLIIDLPISGRNYKNLLDLTPGVVVALGNSSGGGGAASANGLRPESSNEYLVEGLHGMDPFTGQSVIGNITNRGEAGALLPIDAIQEFNTQFNAKAEYGWKAGATVSVGLKSGTNTFHGTGLAFFRREELDARTYYNVASTQPQVNHNLNQFGGTFGGPIKRDKLFFFLGYEQQNFNLGSPSNITAPFTDLDMIANFPACLATNSCVAKANSVAGNRAPDASRHFILACQAVKAAGAASALSPQSLSILGLNPDCTPGPTYPNLFVPHGGFDHGISAIDTTNMNAYYPNTQSEILVWGGLVKADFHVNEKNVINSFYYRGGANNKTAGAVASPDWRRHPRVKAVMGAGTWTWLPNATWGNSFRVGWSNLDQPMMGVDTEKGITALELGIPTGITNPFNAGYPSINVSGFYSMGSGSSERQGPQTSLEINDQVNYLLGKHAVRFGAALLTNNQNGGNHNNAKGTFSFGSSLNNSLASFLAGQNPVVANPAAGIIDPLPLGGLQSAILLYGDISSHMRRTSYSLFVQDDYRIFPRLTMNLGLRYEYNTVIRDRDSIIGSFDPNIGLTQEGVQIPRIYNPDYNNFSPRLGFAWDVRGNGKTVIRGGGSIMYELLTMRGFTEAANAAGMAANPTAWIIGCSTAVNTTDQDPGTPGVQVIAPGQLTNCPGPLLTAGGTRNVGSVTWSTSNTALVPNSPVGGANASPVLWDGPKTGASATILPIAETTLQSCNPTIRIKDKVTQPSGRPGGACTIQFADRHLRTPYVETWTLSIQHAILSNVVVDVAYVGNHGVKLFGRTDDNQEPPFLAWNTVITSGANAGKTFLQVCNEVRTSATCQASSLGSAFTTARSNARPLNLKFPYLNNIVRAWNRDISNYNGLQVSVTARNLRGLSITSGYTWAHALEIGTANNGSTGTDAYNNGYDYGAAGSDLRHRVSISTSYAVPAVQGFAGLLEGWRLSGIFRFQVGRPWHPTDSANRDFVGTGKAHRWDLFGDYKDFSQVDYTQKNRPEFFAGCTASFVTDPNCNTLPSGTNPRTALPFVAADMAVNNPTCTAGATSTGKLATLRAFGCWTWGDSAITSPAINTFANITRGRFTGPSYWNLDMNVIKRQRLTERWSAEFRAEIFNILNHPNFAQPASSPNQCSLTECSFGLTTNTPDVAASNPVLGSGGPRRMQFGVKIIF